MFDDKDLLEQKFLRATDIYKVGENAVVIKNDQVILPEINNTEEIIYNNPINNFIYDLDGKKVGQVVDAVVDSKNNLEYIILKSGKKLTPGEIARSGTDALILQNADKPIKINTFKQRNFPKIEKEHLNQKVKVLEAKVEQEKIVKKNHPQTSKKPAPESREELATKPVVKEEPKPGEVKKDIKVIAEEIKQEAKKLIAEKRSLKKQVAKIETTVEERLEPKKVEPKKEEKVKPKTKPKPKPKAKPKAKPKSKAKETEKQPKSKLKTKAKPKVAKKIAKEIPKPKPKYRFSEKSVRPNRILTNNSFLLKRIATKTIHTFNKEIIIKKGDKINQKIVNKALLTGKLKELIINSK